MSKTASAHHRHPSSGLRRPWVRRPWIRRARRLRHALVGGSLLALCLGLVRSGPACGPYFPNSILAGGDSERLRSPIADFERELKRMGSGSPAFRHAPKSKWPGGDCYRCCTSRYLNVMFSRAHVGFRIFLQTLLLFFIVHTTVDRRGAAQVLGDCIRTTHS